MHIFIQLPSVDLSTGVKSEIASLPKLEHNSVRVKNTRQYAVDYKLKIIPLNPNDKIFSVMAN